MRRGWRWTAVPAAAAVLAVLGAVAVLVAAGALLGWRPVAGFVVPAGFLVSVAVLIVRDSAARGRPGGGWLAACVLLAPVALPVFVVVAVVDRVRGRAGIESRWAPAARWYLLAGVVLAVAAGAVAMSQVRVPGISVSTPTASGSFSGQCSSALAASLGTGPYGHLRAGPAGLPPVLAAAQATEAGRCSAAAADRMSVSALCLGGAWMLAMAGEGISRRRGHRGSPAGAAT